MNPKQFLARSLVLRLDEHVPNKPTSSVGTNVSGFITVIVLRKRDLTGFIK